MPFLLQTLPSMSKIHISVLATTAAADDGASVGNFVTKKITIFINLYQNKITGKPNTKTDNNR